MKKIILLFLLFSIKINAQKPLTAILGAFRDEVKLLEDSIHHSVQKDYINIDVISECFDLHVNHGIDYSTKLWTFLCLELSYRKLNVIR